MVATAYEPNRRVPSVKSRRTVTIVIAAALVALVAVVLFATRRASHSTSASGGAGSASNGSVVVPATLAPLTAASVPVPATAKTSSSQRTTVAPRYGPKPTTAPITAPSGVDTIAVAELPPQGRDTLALIAAGGPYPYKQDGVVWENREGRLPKQKRGFYHEFTVVTPASPDRGARRIITGQDGARYYTADHYGSFKLVVDQ